jgi:alpha-N-arabinofuranosidase
MIKAALLAASALFASTGLEAKQNKAEFLWMQYEGSNPAEDAVPLAKDEFRNPILPGFQPDPSIVRVGDDYYVVNSSFGWFPGLPIFHSRDLVNWRQIGNAITSTEDFKLPSVGINRGIFAPTIRWHKGLFYIITTCIECGDNFIITAKDPKGPWSKPIWLKQVTGIDPDLFFDDDGRVWITNNDEPDGPAQYDGHRALWIQEYDLAQGKTIGPRKVVVDRGVNPAEKPIWSEGPHIYKKDGYYYLTAAEGGTSDDHRQTIYRSKSVTGPYVPGPRNPIMTQRDLDPARPLPVYATGHADFVQLPNNDWWAVFLATRPYERNLTNLGRETFLLPVTWKDGWPDMVPPGQAVPLTLRKPRLPQATKKSDWSKWYESFDAKTLGPQWLSRQPVVADWLSLTDKSGSLILHGNGDRFIGQRQRHRKATISTEVRYAPALEKGRAGIAAIADEGHRIFFGVEHRASGPMLVVGATGLKGAAKGEAKLLERPIDLPSGQSVKLRMTVDGGSAEFAYALPKGQWVTILSDADARLLSTEYDGLLFTGTVVGLYAGKAPS